MSAPRLASAAAGEAAHLAHEARSWQLGFRVSGLGFRV